MTAVLPALGSKVPGSAQPREPAVRRVMIVWCPDWPVVAAVAASGDRHSGLASPIAVIDHGEVYACSQLARLEGVRRGMRRRDAAARCPELIMIEHSLERDIRVFEAVLSTIEDATSGVMPIRPGLCAVGVPSRYYGGEREAAAVVAEHLVGSGLWDCRIGIADGIFAAEQAARHATPQDCLIVPVGGSAAFLAELSVGVLEDLDLVSLLRRLGIRSLGDFAALPARDVLTRFGTQGAWIHRLAGGLDSRVAARRPPLDLDHMSTSRHRWRPSSRSSSAADGPRRGSSPSSPGTAWSAPRSGSRSSGIVAGWDRGSGPTRDGSLPLIWSTGSTGSFRATRRPSRSRASG